MRALTVRPGVANSLSLDDWPEPTANGRHLIVKALALGICGTDHEIIAADYGTAPPGSDRLVIGHESLGEVIEPAGDFAKGDRVVGVVRRPDPGPCRACAGGEWDMCLNGDYTERGIKAAHGYGAERFALDPAFAVEIDPALGICGVLLEPATILAKAWDHIERIGGRTRTWKPASVLVTGAGPVGLLAALMGRQRELEVHVFDRETAGPKAQLVETRLSSAVIVMPGGKPCPEQDGFLVSATALTNPAVSDTCDLGRYLDALAVAAIVIPSGGAFAAHGARVGDLAVVLPVSGGAPAS